MSRIINRFQSEETTPNVAIDSNPITIASQCQLNVMLIFLARYSITKTTCVQHSIISNRSCQEHVKPDYFELFEHLFSTLSYPTSRIKSYYLPGLCLIFYYV